MATYVVGDIQGCFTELKSLLERIQFKPNRDTLISVGDLVNRGPDSLATLRFLSELPSFQCTLGNHDLYLLALWQGLQGDSTTLEQVLLAPDCDALLTWLLQHPLILESQGYHMVHAGIPPHWHLTQAKHYAAETTQAYQSSPKSFFQTMMGNQPTHWSESLGTNDHYRYTINALTRLRLVTADGDLDLNIKDSATSESLIPWFEHPECLITEKNPIIFGHWAALGGKTDRPHIIGLDTGCVWGGSLTAYCLESKQYYTVPSSTR